MDSPIIKKTTNISNRFRYALIAIAIAILALYFLSPLIISKLVSSQLHRYGITTDLSIEVPELNYISIPAASFASHNQDIPVNVALQDIEIHYRLWELLSTQKVQALKIGSVKLDLTADLAYFNNNTSRPNKQQINLSNYLPSEVFSQIPAANISIRNLGLYWQASQAQLLSFKGKLNLTENRLDLNLQYFENNLDIAHIDAELTSANDFSFSLSDQTTNSLDALNRLTISGKAIAEKSRLLIQSQSSIQLDHFNRQSFWLTPQLLTAIENSQVSLNINKQVSLPVMFSDIETFLTDTTSSAKFNYQMNSSAINTLIKSDIELEKMSAKGSGTSQLQKQALTITLLADNQLKAEQIQTAQVNAAKIEATLNTPFTVALSAQAGTSAPTLQLADFSASITSKSLSTAAGAISHQPITVTITDINPLKHSLKAQYRIPKLTLVTEHSKTALPFALLESQITGAISLNSASIKNTILPASQIDLYKVSAALLTSDQLTFSNNQSLTLTYNRQNKQLSIEDQAISIKAAIWQSLYGEIKHPELFFEISQINTDKQSAKLNIEALTLSLRAKKLPFKNLALYTQLQAEINQEALSLTLNKGLKLDLKDLQSNGIRTQKLSITSTTATKLSLNNPTQSNASEIMQQINIEPSKLRVTGSTLKYKKHTASYRSVALNLKKIALSPLRIKAQTHITGINVISAPIVKNIDINAYHDISQNQHKVNAHITGRNIPFSVKAQANSQKNYQKTHAKWQFSPLNIAEHNQAIANALKLPLPKDFSVISGEYSHTGQLDINKDDIKASLKHRIKDLNIRHKETSIEGINSSSNSTFANNKLSQAGSLSIRSINNAVPITNISTAFKIYAMLSDKPRVHISNTTALALDASLKLDDFTITLSPLSGHSVIYFSKLPLNNILALEQQPSLVGTGTLAGKLPFSFKGDKLWIKDGDIYSTDSGYIRYSANDNVRAYAKTNKGLEIALNVLEDFHYKVLSIDANYTPDGKLILRNKLSGKNPNWQQGQPIEFAINIEENVLQLLKTLQFSDQLSEKIQKQIETKTP
jgi:hypothetical protein